MAPSNAHFVTVFNFFNCIELINAHYDLPSRIGRIYSEVFKPTITILVVMSRM